jgi:hypothetical protein
MRRALNMFLSLVLLIPVTINLEPVYDEQINVRKVNVWRMQIVGPFQVLPLAK